MVKKTSSAGYVNDVQKNQYSGFNLLAADAAQFWWVAGIIGALAAVMLVYFRRRRWI